MDILGLSLSTLPTAPGSKEANGEDLNKKRKKLANFIILIFSVLTLGSGYVLYIALRFLINEMALRNILVTFRTDGEIKAVMRGEECIRYILKIENHRIDPWGFDIFQGSLRSYAEFLAKAAEKKKQLDPGFKEEKLQINQAGELVKDSEGHPQLRPELVEAIKQANSSTFLEELLGVIWIGLPPYRIFTYQFRWMKYGQKRAEKGVPSDQVGVHPRDEEVDSLFFRYPQYAIVLKNVETGAGSIEKDGKNLGISQVQINAVLVFETKTVNPQKTLFRTAALSSAGDWQQALVREITNRARMWIGRTTWDILTKQQKEVEETLTQIAQEINAVDENGLPIAEASISSVRDYGQIVVKITMPQVDLQAGGLQEAYENVIKAQKKRDADIAEAEGKRALAGAPLKGKADGLQLISEVEGGKEMYISEQVGNIGVYAPGSGQNLLFNVSGEKKPPRKTDEEEKKK